MKTMPDMLSVLSTAASEDVAHLLGGVDLALEGDPKLIRHWFWCKADSSYGSFSFVVLRLAPLLRRRSPC